MPQAFVPFLQQDPPALGSVVKVWFEKREKVLFIEGEGGRRWRDIYGVCLEDVQFSTDATPRGATRCFATGKLLGIPGTNESHEVQRDILKQSRDHLEFYWWRDKRWPILSARLAYLSPPHGGFMTNVVVDPVARSTVD